MPKISNSKVGAVGKNSPSLFETEIDLRILFTAKSKKGGDYSMNI